MINSLLTCHLFSAFAEPGAIPGNCLLCGTATENGWLPTGFTDTVARRYIIPGGTVFCPLCRGMMRHRHCRTRCWVATRNGVHFSSIGDDTFWRALVDPPEPPFAIYHTKGGKKQGWIGILYKVNYSRNSYWIGTDRSLYLPLLARKSDVFVRSQLVANLLQRTVRRSAVMVSSFSPAEWERSIREGWQDLLLAAQHFRHDPLWEVLVSAYPYCSRDRVSDVDAGESKPRLDKL